MQQMKKMGGMGSILAMMPGMGGTAQADVDMAWRREDPCARVEAMILSMTPEERANPDLTESFPKDSVSLTARA